MYFCPGAATRRTTCPKEWIAKYKGKFDAGWDDYREKTLANQIKMGICPPGTKLSPHDPDVADWNTLTSEREGAVRPRDGSVCGLPVLRRPTITRRAGRVPEAIGPARQHADHVGVRQRRQPRGRAHWLVQREPVLQQRAGTASSRTSSTSTNWGGPAPIRTTPGAGPGPPTRPSAAGSARPAAASPTCASSTGPRASKPRARFARSSPTPSTWCRPCLKRLASSRRRRLRA